MVERRRKPSIVVPSDESLARTRAQALRLAQALEAARQPQRVRRSLGPVGSFVVDGEGTILAFDRGMQRLTGWAASEVIGQHKDLGVYHQPDELGVRGFQLRPLFHGTLPKAPAARGYLLYLTRRDGQLLQVEAIMEHGGPRHSPRLGVEVRRVLARFPAPGSTTDSASVDPITGLPRASVFEERARRVAERARETGLPFSMLVLDIDHLRHVYRSAGQARGDEILRQVAGILRASVRESDLIARVDRSDFGLALPSAGRGDARRIGGRLRRIFEGLALRGLIDGSEVNVTLSVGAACHPADGEDVADLVAISREALAEATRLGHNRVWCQVRRPRALARFPVFFNGPVAGLLGTARNVSSSGILLETEEELPAGMRVALAMDLPHGRPAKAVGRVSRATRVRGANEDEALALGIEFEHFEADARRRLDELVSQIMLNSA
jgi:diguanylate cyclase (GGDEF)-like protein/PAS domain S-box-containing protein